MDTRELAVQDRTVLAHARTVTRGLLDDLRPDLLRHSGRVHARVKADGTPVTAADVDADRHIAAAVRDAFPDHGLVSEECATRYDGQRFAWVVDPIDGTSNFTAGLPYWCVSIALLLDGEPVFAAIDAPAIDARYEAELGRGASRDGHAIRVGAAVDWRSGDNRHVPLMLSSASARRARSRVRLNARVMGSIALDLCAVAEGVAAAAISRVPKVWDVAAGALIVTEAGGACVALEQPGLLPLEPGVELAGRSAPYAAGPDAAYVRELAGLLAPG